MLHLRVIAPAELRDSVMDALTDNPGVAHLVIHRDAAQDPPGDEITADIARKCANDVIGALKALGVKERGAITLDVVDTVMSTRAYRAEERAAGDPADAVGVGPSAAQLAINLVGIALAGVAVLWARGLADRRHWHMVG